jgi:hypothetical protein
VQHRPRLTPGRRALWSSLCALGAAGLLLILAAAPAAAAEAARKRPDPLVAPARIGMAELAKPGARLRIHVRRGTRAMQVTLRRRGGARVVARKLRRVRARRHARRVVVRLRVRIRVMRRLRPGVYVIRVRTRRPSGRWSRRVLRERIRLVAPVRRVAGRAPRPVATTTTPPQATPPGPPPPPPVTVAAAGDISCDSPCASTQGTAALVRDVIRPGAVLALGDVQYPDATTEALNAFYDKSWGAFKAITYAVPGNHDLVPSRSNPDYVDYFNAGGPVQLVPQASYSFDLGAWHVVALNSVCFTATGCSNRSSWTSWLKRDLAANPRACTLAFLHHPYWTSPAPAARNRDLEPWIDALYDAGADVLLQAHQHVYERFHPQNPDSVRDDARGIVAFTVGTGGGELVQFKDGAPHPNSAARSDDDFGVLQLTLRSGGYDFRFHSVGGAYADAGSARCH